ncbi:serine hydrolase [Thalassotalea sp. SU-HH00458]|uniref:serine hydrolase n=1 Tax=Thalassotalea sp. SU-HH00458 TaxID=3127657 RepID=UPI0031068C26
MKFIKLLSIAVVFVIWPFTSNAQSNVQHNHRIKDVISQAMAVFQVPGVAVAIIKDDKVVMNQGFGVIEHGKPTKVNSDTLFGIASNTKAMTSALIAQLVDQGKLSWKTKVIDIIPEFQMPNAYVTREFTLVDLLSHNSGLGLGAGDLMIWPETTHTIDDIIKGIKYLPEVSSFRSEYAYDNLMYIIAGEIIARVTGRSWEENIQQNIFTPLSMTTTRSKFSLIEKTNANVARAHVPLNGEINVVGGNFLEKFHSAASVASSVNDMSLWLKAQLNRGVYQINGKEARLFSPQQSRKMWQAHTLKTVSESAMKNDKTHFSAYGLGWDLKDYHGVKLVQHTGGILGMISKVVMVPEENLALVILTNQQSGYAFNAIANTILHRYLNISDTDWVKHYQAIQEKRTAKEKARLAQESKKIAKDSKPSLPLAEYAQTYQDNWYGNIDITFDGKQLHMQFSKTAQLTGTLTHYQHNTFIVHWQDRTLEADAFVNFNLREDGSINFATMKAVSKFTDFSFDFHDLKLTPLP